MPDNHSSPTQPPSRIGAMILAIIAPLVVLGWAAQWFSQEPTDDKAQREKWNIDEMEAKIRDEKPEIVLIGNSMIRYGVDLKMLSETLGARVTALNVSGTRAPTWYLVLKNRVLAQDHRPHAVLVMGAARAMLGNQFGGNLAANAHRGPVEEVVDAKTSGQKPEPAQWKWAKIRRDQLRSNLLDGIRNWTASIVFSDDIETAEAETAEEWATSQLTKVFNDEAAMQDITASRVIPVVEAQEEQVRRGAMDVQDTFIPDFIKLAEDNDMRMVFVRVPVAPSGPSSWEADEDAAEPLMKRTLAWLNGQDAGFLDMRTIGLTDTDFVDYLHLNKTGRRKMTKALGAYLLSMDLMGTKPLPRAVSRTSSPLKRTGPLPRLAGLKTAKATLTKGDCSWKIPFTEPIEIGSGRLTRMGIGKTSPIILKANGTPVTQTHRLGQVEDGQCRNTAFLGRRLLALSTAEPDGLPAQLSISIDSDFPSKGLDGSANYWVFPGQTVTTTFDDAWDQNTGPFRAEVIGVQAGEGLPLSIAINGATPVTATQTGNRVEALLTDSAPSGPWTLSLTVPPQGAPTLVQSLSVGEGVSQTWLIGSPNTLTTRRAIGGKRAKVTYDQPPPSIKSGTPENVGDGTVRFDGADFRRLNDRHASRKSGIWPCSPVRVAYQGEVVGQPHKKCSKLMSFEPGSYCHMGAEVLLHPPGGPNSIDVPDDWTIVLDPDRKCGKGRWLYPGDKLVAQPWVVDTAAIPAGIRSIAIQASIIGYPNPDVDRPSKGPDEPMIDFTVLHGETPIMQNTIKRDQFTGDPLFFAIDPPLQLGRTPLSFVFESRPEGPYMVVSSASVSEVELSAPDSVPAEGAAP